MFTVQGERRESRMTPLITYMVDGKLLRNPVEAQKVKKNSSRYTLLNGHLFSLGFS